MEIELSEDLKPIIEKNKGYLLKEVRLHQISMSNLESKEKIFSYSIKIKKL
jgi:hypothetical protein